MISGFPRKTRLAMSPIDSRDLQLAQRIASRSCHDHIPYPTLTAWKQSADAFCRFTGLAGQGPVRRSGRLREPLHRGGDALVGGGQRDADMLCAARAVEIAGRHQNAARGQPRDAVLGTARRGWPTDTGPPSEWSMAKPAERRAGNSAPAAARSARVARVRGRRRPARRPWRPASAWARSSRRVCAPPAARRPGRGSPATKPAR